MQHIARQFPVASDRAERLWCNQGRPMVMLGFPKGRSLAMDKLKHLEELFAGRHFRPRGHPAMRAVVSSVQAQFA